MGLIFLRKMEELRVRVVNEFGLVVIVVCGVILVSYLVLNFSYWLRSLWMKM